MSNVHLEPTPDSHAMAAPESYAALCDAIKGIITERRFNAGYELVASRWEVGEAIVNHPTFERQQGRAGSVIQDLGRDLDIHPDTIYLAVRFYERWPDADFQTAVNKMGLGKHQMHWSHVRALLPPAALAEIEERGADEVKRSEQRQSKRSLIEEFSKSHIAKIWTWSDHNKLMSHIDRSARQPKKPLAPIADTTAV
jgi:hypothetical protein